MKDLQIKEIKQCVIQCIFDRPLNRKAKAKDLRGALAYLYGDDSLFHHHINERLIYKYPLIQYKIIKNKGIVVGLGQGALAVAGINLVNKSLTIRNEQYIVENCIVSFLKNSFGICEQKEYKFLSPWLGLNESNYQKYQLIGDNTKRLKLLEKILVGNIISLCKGVEYTISEQVNVNILNIREANTILKGTPMLGFFGTFSVNFEIPDYWGIGKSVSRGFGTIKKI